MSEILKKEINKYRHYLEHLREIKISIGNHLYGEIEIITDPQIILELEEETKSLLRDKNQSAKWGRIGLVYEDQYCTIFRDLVIFPSNKYGTYIRIIPKSKINDCTGAAILPFLNGKIILQKNFRHATRDWEIEIPRGSIGDSKSPMEAAKRELKEEMGYKTNKIVSLGEINPDSGFLSSKIKLFLAYVQNEKPEKKQEFSEAISDNLYYLAPNEIDFMIKDNRIKDAITISAIYFAKLKGYL